MRIVIWSSGDADALKLVQRIQEAIGQGQIPGTEMAGVFCNRCRGEDEEADKFLAWCDEHHLPAVCVSSRQLRQGRPTDWREELGREARRRLADFGADLHLLVGYMLWLDDETCERLPLLNLHPALPGGPVGTWQEVIRQLMATGATRTGATMQLVRPGVENRDHGTPVTFFQFPIAKGMTFDQIRQQGFVREPFLLVETLRALARGEIRIEGHRVIGPSGEPLPGGYDLTTTVNQLLRRNPFSPRKIVCFDLEGPLSPQDNAYEVMGLVPNGHQIFEVISRYDDLLALEGRADYEPGTTLALIVPFLVLHGLSEEDVERVSAQAALVGGARELIADLQGEGWSVHIISTSYQQHALQTARRLGVEPEDVACTSLPLTRYREQLTDGDRILLVQTERDILDLYPARNDKEIKRRLDQFFWTELPQTGLGKVLEEVRVMGGRRKAEAARIFAGRRGRTLADVAAIGDSITDAALLQAVHQAGGLAVAFNANQYALPHAAVGLASAELRELYPVLAAWREGGREGVKSALAGKTNPTWLGDGEDLEDVLALHMEMRRQVRSVAAELG